MPVLCWMNWLNPGDGVQYYQQQPLSIDGSRPGFLGTFSFTKLRHRTAPRMDARVPVKKVACGPQALQITPPKADPAIIPVFSHSAP